MDPHYVMYELQLWELSGIFQAIETQSKSEMEDKRFWSYLQIMPHVDSKKLKKPSDLLPFPWEKENRDKKLKQEFEDKSVSIAAFLNKQKDKE